jgi:hypothetical protein
MKKSALRAVSQKRQAQKNEYNSLVMRLKIACGCKSELSGKLCSVYDIVPHHIDGRRGLRLIDPFNIILITDEEHTGDNGIQKHNSWEAKQKLLDIVRKIRQEQGFLEEGKC